METDNWIDFFALLYGKSYHVISLALKTYFCQRTKQRKHEEMKICNVISRDEFEPSWLKPIARAEEFSAWIEICLARDLYDYDHDTGTKLGNLTVCSS